MLRRAFIALIAMCVAVPVGLFSGIYFAEYATQSGTWAAIGFPITSKTARNTFYEYANFTYQIGVFFSRSSGLYIKSNLKMIWILPL